MRRIREALRLHLQAGLSYNEVGFAIKISKSAVGKVFEAALGFSNSWAGAQSSSTRRPRC
jgi:hypothetical protein